MGYGLLVDSVVAVHVLFMVFVVFGELLILAGIERRWNWVRNPWFRLAHLAAILIVALETLAGSACPLTVWERDLRVLAGQPVTDATFIGRIMHGVLFYDLPSWVFTAAYLTFCALVVATFVLAPPRRRRPGQLAPAQSIQMTR